MLLEGFENGYRGVTFFQQARNALCHEEVTSPLLQPAVFITSY